MIKGNYMGLARNILGPIKVSQSGGERYGMVSESKEKGKDTRTGIGAWPDKEAECRARKRSLGHPYETLSASGG